ncbi:MAG: hypothetical protein P8013_00275 [Candidatus Sulfobium sp.]|jgi:hypothetical protein
MKGMVLSGLSAIAGFLLLGLLNGIASDGITPGLLCRGGGFFGTSNAYAGEGPYGGSQGGTYGEKQQVTTKKEARKLLQDYFSKKDVTIGEIREKQYYFEADVLDSRGKVIDKVIVDKRTGRIRSIY